MLLEPDGSPAWRSEDVLRVLPDALAEHTRGETHGLALELATDPHATVARGRVPSCASCAPGWRDAVRGLGLRAAVAGTHPLVRAEEVEVSPGARYQYLHRVAARARPARADVRAARARRGARPELAVRAYNGMRAHIPVLLALAANSPFTRGRDSGLASARTPVFQAFPRTGIPREFASYAELRRGRRRAAPLRRDPRADVHLVGRAAAAQARHARGAGDGRADAHPRHRRAGRAGPVPGAAARRWTAWPSRSSAHAPEVLDENRFLAARDGIDGAAARPAPRPLRARRRAAWRRWSTPAGRTRGRSAASASWRCSPTSPATRARRASARSRPSPRHRRPAARAAGRVLAAAPAGPRRSRALIRSRAEFPAGLSRPGREESATDSRDPGRRAEDPACVQHPFSWEESSVPAPCVLPTSGRKSTDDRAGSSRSAITGPPAAACGRARAPLGFAKQLVGGLGSVSWMPGGARERRRAPARRASRVAPGAARGRPNASVIVSPGPLRGNLARAAGVARVSKNSAKEASCAACCSLSPSCSSCSSSPRRMPAAGPPSGRSVRRPPAPQPGTPWHVNITVLQHGRDAALGSQPGVTITNGDATKTSPPRRPASPGVYRAQVVFPTAGRWTYEIDDGFISEQPHTYPAVQIGRAPRPPRRPLTSGPNLLWLIPGIALLLAAAAIPLARPGRARHEPQAA